MKKKILAIMLLILFIGCSASHPKQNEIASNFLFPASLKDLQAYAPYKLYYTGEKTGIQYYLKEIATDEIRMHLDNDQFREIVILGDDISYIYLPVVEEEIVVQFDYDMLEDIVEIQRRISYEKMMKMEQHVC